MLFTFDSFQPKVNEEPTEFDDLPADHDYIIHEVELTTFSQNSVAYIAGFVVRKVERRLNCGECVSVLLDSEDDPLDDDVRRLITLRNKGGLKIPSKSVHTVCKLTEQEIKLCLSKDLALKSLSSSRPKRHIKSRVMRRLVGTDIFSSIQGHLLTEEVGEENHYTNLISILIECYVDVKLHAVAKTYTMGEVGEPIRHKLSKLIIFKHQ